MSNSPNIRTLNVGENQNLRTIDVTKLLFLEELWVNGNGIENLDVSENPNLERLECSQNSLTKLDVSHNPRIEFLSCWGNKLAGESMDKLIASLAKETEGTEREFCVYNKLYDKEHNSLTVKQATAVKERGWTPMQATGSMDLFTWKEFDGDDATGISNATMNSKDNGAWYDLNGRRIAQPVQKGIYIHGGKENSSQVTTLSYTVKNQSFRALFAWNFGTFKCITTICETQFCCCRIANVVHWHIKNVQATNRAPYN